MKLHKYFGNYFSWLLCLVFCLSSTWAAEVFALDRGLDLRLSAQQEYNDNIFYSIDDEIEDYITTLSGGLTFQNRTERSNTDLSARVERLVYQDWDELDATDQFYSGKVDHVFTSRWQGGISAGFSRDSRPDRDMDITGLVLGAAERDQLNGGVFATYQATENTDASFSYNYFDVAYDQGEFSDEFSDSVGHQVGLGLNHNWSRMFPNTTLHFNVNHARYEYDSSDILLYSGTIGLSKRISELWLLSLSGGARYQETEFLISGQTVLGDENRMELSDEKWGSVWNVDMNYQGELGHFGLYGKHDIMPSSGLDGSTERTSLGMKLYYRVAKKSGVGIIINYHLNQADAGQLATEDVDNETWQISPHVKLSLLDDFYLIARYQYSQVESRITEKISSRSFAILQLAYNVTLWD
jgi:hypothetical protein